MKVGILTYHCAHNYGAILQCYALQETLRGMGYETQVINYRPKFLVAPYRTFQRYRFSLRKPYRIPFELWRELRYAVPRWFKFEKSIKRLLHMSDPSDFVTEDFDVYVIGSDQIWNTRISGGDLAYFASFDFPKVGKKYIAYGASMEASALSDEDESICKRCLPLFDSIGVREDNLVSMLQPFTNVDLVKVSDPVFLLDQSQWKSLILPKSPKEKYLLLYQVRENETVRKYAENVAKQKGLKIVEVTAWVKRTPYTEDDYQTASVEEFLTLLWYADYIVTTSFHGTAFSLVFEKQFTAVELGDGADSRVRQLLGRYGLTTRISTLSDDFDRSFIQFDDVKTLIAKDKTDSRLFLSVSIDSNH